MKNKYIYRAKISENKFKQFLHLFCLDLTASQIAEVTGINRNTVNRYLAEIRCRISDYCQNNCSDCVFGQSLTEREIEYRKGGKTLGNNHLVGIVKEDGKIRCKVIPGCEEEGISPSGGAEKCCNHNQAAIGLEKYNGFIDLSRMKYIKAPSNGGNGNGRKHGIDICEGFWGHVRTRLQRFRGLKKSRLLGHIHECEFRYNHNRKEMYPILLGIFRDRPLFQQPDISTLRPALFITDL